MPLADILAIPRGILGREPDGTMWVTCVRDGRLLVLTGPIRPAADLAPEETASIFTDLITAHADGATAVIVAGYGPSEQVIPVTDAFRPQLAAAGIPVTDIVRVENGRYWSCIRESPLEGEQVGPDRSHDVLASAAGPEAQELARHTAAAEDWLRQVKRDDPGDGFEAAAQAGIAAVTAAIQCYCEGGTLAGDRAALARLAVALRNPWTLLDALARMNDARGRSEHLRLWVDVTTCARPGYVAGPAALVAHTALQSGVPALARAAVSRADEDPGQHLGRRIADIIARAGFPVGRGNAFPTPPEMSPASSGTARPGGAPNLNPEVPRRPPRERTTLPRDKQSPLTLAILDPSMTRTHTDPGPAGSKVRSNMTPTERRRSFLARVGPHKPASETRVADVPAEDGVMPGFRS